MPGDAIGLHTGNIFPLVITGRLAPWERWPGEPPFLPQPSTSNLSASLNFKGKVTLSVLCVLQLLQHNRSNIDQKCLVQYNFV